MDKPETSVAVFIDYDNLMPTQQMAGLLDIVTKALIQIPLGRKTRRVTCDIRVYGGWFEGRQMTRRAQEVTIEVQRDFPRLIRLPRGTGDHIAVSVNAELAVSLSQEPGHHLFNTYRRKGRPYNVRVEEPSAVGCTDAHCILPLMRKLLKKGACPKPGCGVVSRDLVYRDEQKIVDTMLCCDLIHAATAGHERIVLLSGDDDFLPPLRTILLSGAEAVRLHPRPTGLRASFPTGGAKLLEMDL